MCGCWSAEPVYSISAFAVMFPQLPFFAFGNILLSVSLICVTSHCSTGQPFTPPEFAKVLSSINEECENRTSIADGIAALTSLDRDSWADFRDHMIKISEPNRLALDTINTAVAVLAIDPGDASVSNVFVHVAVADVLNSVVFVYCCCRIFAI